MSDLSPLLEATLKISNIRSSGASSDRKTTLLYAKFSVYFPYHPFHSLILTHNHPILSIDISCLHQPDTSIQHRDTPSMLGYHLAAIYMIVPLHLVHSCCCVARALHLLIAAQTHQLHQHISLIRVIIQQCLHSTEGQSLLIEMSIVGSKPPKQRNVDNGWFGAQSSTL